MSELFTGYTDDNNESAWSFIVDNATQARGLLKRLEKDARTLKTAIVAFDSDWRDNKRECIAHATLAMRAIETARMHYWKVIQYSDKNISWESTYDKKS